MNIRHLSIFLAVSLVAAFRPAIAEDTDLFVRANANAQPPNVLFVIDNAANFSATSQEGPCVMDGVYSDLNKQVSPNQPPVASVGAIEQCALYSTISALDPESVNIGIMVYNASGVRDWNGRPCQSQPSDPGGCLVYPIKPMTDINKGELLSWIQTWKDSGSGPGYIKANSEATGGSMQEAWAYFNGRIGLSSRDYADMVPPTTCNKFIIFVGNSFNNSGSPGDQTGDKGPQGALNNANSTARMNAFPPATLAERTPMNRTITTNMCGTATLGNPHETNGYYADEWSRYMYGHGITTFTIGLIGRGCQANYVALLTNTAQAGGGKYFETQNTQELKDAFGAALGAMIARNAVFASVSLPVSVTTQGYYLNQVFIGMFRPDSLALPRWFGNLKQYRLGRPEGSTTGIELQDARDPAEPAISIARSGFISNCALSYWTPTSDDSYWTSIVTPTCTGHPGPSNTPDGDVVEKGGHAYKLRASSVGSRNVKTCSSAECTGIASFDTSTGWILDGDPERENLINWARGLNNHAAFPAGDATDPDAVMTNVASTAMRPSVHGDVIHSRPVAINYGTDVAPQVVVYYGANDGALRAVNGNRTTATPGSVPAGGEIWSFIPPEFYPQIPRLRENSQSIAYIDNPVTDPEPLPKPYGFDGPVSADVKVPVGGTVTDTGGHAWIFASMRRGGRAVYAFDVTSLGTDAPNPTLKWKIGCSTPIGDDSGCAAGWSGIGQTWSTPKVFRAGGFGGGVSPMLIMGGGYGGACEDADPVSCTTTSKGSSIYVIDADDGTKLREFVLSANGGRGVAADIFVVPVSDTNPLAKWIYALDLGGNLYRISGATANQPIGATPPASWTITRIASLGCGTDTTGCSNKRKFMMMPDVVETPSGMGVYYLMFGSGDREKPLGDRSAPGDDPQLDPYWPVAFNTTNYFFAIKDFPTDPCWSPGSGASPGPCTGHTPVTMASLAEIDVATTDQLALAKGWYLPLRQHEQVVTTAITVFGITTFSTHTPHVPVQDSCGSDTGTARVYNVRYYDAAPKRGAVNRSEIIDGPGGLPPSPVAGMVTLDGEESAVPFLIGGSASSPLEGGEPSSPSTTTLPKSVTYWFIRK